VFYYLVEGDEWDDGWCVVFGEMVIDMIVMGLGF